MNSAEYRAKFLDLAEEFRKTNETAEYVAVSSAFAIEMVAVCYGIIMGNSKDSADEYLERVKERIDVIKSLFGDKK